MLAMYTVLVCFSATPGGGAGYRRSLFFVHRPRSRPFAWLTTRWWDAFWNDTFDGSEDATTKPKILPPFCAESLAKNHIMIYCLVMLKVMGLQIHGSSKDGIACQRDTASYTYYVYFTYNTVWWNNLEATKIFPLLCMNRQLQSYSTFFSGK